MGILIEHYGGNMPLWLAPEQIRILPISEKTTDYANGLLTQLKQAGLRVKCDASNEKIGAKIAKSHADKIPYMLVVGPKEAETGDVGVRWRKSKITKTLKIDEFISIAAAKIADKTEQLDID
jgi:threonyl-tRNA synthetase